MSTALQIINAAYRRHNLNEVSAFSTSLEFPYNLAKDILNTVIKEMNRMGNYWFTETKTPLTYTSGVYSYNLSSLGIDPKRVIRLETEATDHYGALTQLNWRDFRRLYRRSTISTAEPMAWSKFGTALELSVKPDQDYSIHVYHFKDMPLVVNTTDTLLIPELDEDVLEAGCFAYLSQAIGKGDFQIAYELFVSKAESLLADMKEDAGMPLQMPATF